MKMRSAFSEMCSKPQSGQNNDQNLIPLPNPMWLYSEKQYSQKK